MFTAEIDNNVEKKTETSQIDNFHVHIENRSSVNISTLLALYFYLNKKKLSAMSLSNAKQCIPNSRNIKKMERFVMQKMNING